MKKKEKNQVEASKGYKPNTQQLAIQDEIPENQLSEKAKNQRNRKNGKQRKFSL